MSETLFDLPPLKGGAGDEWATPQHFFDMQHRRYEFTVDAASTVENAKLPKRFKDGLSASWRGERVWCNPPYSDPARWCEKAEREMLNGCPLSVLLLPVDTSTRWFHDFIYGIAEIQFIKGRLTFVGAPSMARFASMLAIYRPEYERERASHA